MSAPYVIQTIGGPRLSDAERLTALCDRFRIVDAGTGETLWAPHVGGDPDDLRVAIDRWANGGGTVEVDPANPLSYLLVECVCNPRQVVNCPVHGPRRRGRHPYVHRGRGKYERPGAVERHAAIRAHYAESQNYRVTAEAFGISWQRVQQIVRRGAFSVPLTPEPHP